MTTTRTPPTDLPAALAEIERMHAINHSLCATVNHHNHQGAISQGKLRAAEELIYELEDANRPAAILVHASRALIASLTAELAQEREVFESTLLLTAQRSNELETEARQLRAVWTSITTAAALNALRFEVASMIRDECALDQVTEDRLTAQAADRVIGARRLVERIEADAGVPHVHVTARGCQS